MRDRKRRCTSRTLIEPLELENCMRIVCCTVETTPKTHAARRAWWDALQRLETPACGIRSAAAPFAPNSARWNSTHACWAPSSGTRLTHCYHTMKQRDNPRPTPPLDLRPIPICHTANRKHYTSVSSVQLPHKVGKPKKHLGLGKKNANRWVRQMGP